MVYKKLRGKLLRKRQDAIRKFRLGEKLSEKDVRMAALGGIGKVSKQKYGYAPANYSRGTGGGTRPIKEQSTVPTQMTDLAFNKTLDEKINQVHVKMEQVQGEADIYRCQGEIAALRKLKYLRDEINGGK